MIIIASPCDHADGGDGVESSKPVAQLPGSGHLHGHQSLSHLILQLNLPLKRHPVNLSHKLLLPLLRAVGRRGRLFAARLPHVSVSGRPLKLIPAEACGQNRGVQKKRGTVQGSRLGFVLFCVCGVCARMKMTHPLEHQLEFHLVPPIEILQCGL